jgi:ssDNA-binding replication factor A large subunit
MDSDNEVLDNLQKLTNSSKEELQTKIENKRREMKGLLSFEGAAHLVAREYGKDLFNKTESKLPIKDLASGMKNCNFIGRVFKISNINEFKRKDNSLGRVVNLFVGDNSGFVKLALWDSQVNLVEDGTMKAGSLIEVVNAIVKENVFGDLEVAVGKYGAIKSVENADFMSEKEMDERYLSGKVSRVQLENLFPGAVEIAGTVVDIFRGNSIFNICSICGTKMAEQEGKLVCSSHGAVESNPALVLSFLIDDGTGSARAVSFRQSAENLLGVTAGELRDMEIENRNKFITEKLIGKQLLLKGRAKRNKIFDRIEIIADEATEINPLEESKSLLGEVERKLTT